MCDAAHIVILCHIHRSPRNDRYRRHDRVFEKEFLKVRRSVEFTENSKTVTVWSSKDKVALLIWEGNKLQNQLNRYWLIIQNFKIGSFSRTWTWKFVALGLQLESLPCFVSDIREVSNYQRCTLPWPASNIPEVLRPLRRDRPCCLTSTTKWIFAMVHWRHLDVWCHVKL